MKRYLSTFCLLSLSLFLLNSCDLLKDLNYTVNPNPLVLKGDSVQFAVDVKIPEKGIKKKVKADISAKLGSQQIGVWTIQGEKVTGNGKTISFKPGGTATFEMTLPYEDYMKSADLTISAKVYKGKKEKAKEAIAETKIADATIITQKLVSPVFNVFNAKHNLVRKVVRDATSNNSSISAKINFDKGKSLVKSKELKDQDIKDIVQWVKDNSSNEKIKINSIQINGYASPDGEETKNDALSNDRSISARKSMMKLFKKEKMKSFADTSMYTLSKFGEDFEGFKKQLAKTTTISEGDKALFIRILDMKKDPAEREKEMINLGKSYDALERDVFPAIRRSSIVVNYTEFGLTDEELVDISKSNKDSLNVEEILFTFSELLTDRNEQIELLQHGAEKFPNEYRIINNLGVLYFTSAKLEDAEKAFSKANELSDNYLVKNNCAAIKILNGNREDARSLMQSAIGGASAEEKEGMNYNMSILDVMDGNYSAAEKGFSKPSFNKALNLLLLNKLDDSEGVIGKIDDEKMNHYLNAIIAARKGQAAEQVVSYLNKAFAMDQSLKAMAAEDREFVKFFENTVFKSAVN